MLTTISAAVPLLPAPCWHCDSAIGRAVHAGIFGDAFWPNVGLVLAPLLVLLGVVAAIHGGAFGRCDGAAAAGRDEGP